MSKRAATYSRFSTELQNAKSIEDQNAVTARYCQQNGYEVVRQYSDAAQSGASIMGRQGLLDLLADAKDGLFDVIVVEEIDRISRDMEDMAGIYKRMQFLGIEIIGIHEGTASTVTVGLRSIVSQLFREDNARKVRRGMEGLVKSGLSAGGQAYGFRADPMNKGKLIQVPEEIEIVQRIFREFVEGKSPRHIATDLQAENIPPPRGAAWAPSAIYGWAARGTGILRNQLYVGKIVWNKNKMVKDPDTGNRVSRANPPDEWRYHDAPEYRVIDQELFDRVQDIIKPKNRSHQEIRSMKRPQRLLSGLLKCGYCGGGMTVKGADKSGRTRIECSRHRDSRSCPNPYTYYLDRVEECVLDGLRKELSNPDVLVEFVHHYNEARKELAAHMMKGRATLVAKIDDGEKRLERITKLLIDGIGDSADLGQQHKKIAQGVRLWKQELALEPEPMNVVALHPAAISAYKDALMKLRDVVHDDHRTVATFSSVLRELVKEINVTRGDAKGEIDVQVIGKLRALLSDTAPRIRVGGTMVAGEGLEPPTRGL